MMSSSTTQWFKELQASGEEMMNSSSLDHELMLSHLDGDFQQYSLSPDTHACSFYPSFSTPSMEAERPKKINKTSTWNTCTTVPTGHCNLINLAFKKEMEGLDSNDGLKWYGETLDRRQGVLMSGTKPGSVRLQPNYASEHIIAERKRREKLSERFVALAAVIPGLKKTDKASVLGTAVKYVKDLEERLKFLEDQKTKKTEPVILIKKSADKNDTSNSINENCDGSSASMLLPEIEVRLCTRTLLVKIHCSNGKGVLVKVLSEIEKRHLMVTNTSVIPFQGSNLDITISAQMEEQFSLTVEDLVKELHSAFSHLT